MSSRVTLQDRVRSLASGTTGGGAWGETLRVLGMTGEERERERRKQNEYLDLRLPCARCFWNRDSELPP